MSCFVPLGVRVPQVWNHCSKGLLKNYVTLLINTFKDYCCTVYLYLINYLRAY